MSFFFYLRVELKRIFNLKSVYLVMILTMLCPMAGYKIYKTAMLQTKSGDLIANPTMAGAIGGGILFALLTLVEFDRGRKYKTGVLINSIVSPLVINIVRLMSIGVAAIISVSITAVLYFPYTFIKMGNIFDPYTYWNSFFLLMLPSILLSILVISALYQIFNNTSISMIAFIALVLVGFSKWFEDNNISHWINPIISSYSDFFGNDVIFLLMQHSRLFWFLVFGGMWLIGLISVRQYGKGIFKSVLYNSRKVYIPLLAVALISGGVYAYINQPMIALKSQQSEKIEKNEQLELDRANLELNFDTNRGRISGKVTYLVKNLSNSEQECNIRVNTGFNIHHITANEKDITFRSLNSKKDVVTITLPRDKEIKVNLEYDGIPKFSEEFGALIAGSNTIGNKCIDLFGANNIYPQIRALPNKEGAPVTGEITMPGSLTPVVYGEKVQKDDELPARNVGGNTVKLLSQDGKNKKWSFQANGEGFMNILAGDYVIKKLGDENMPMEFYYSQKTEESMKDKNTEKVIHDTIEFCTSYYGKLHNTSKDNPVKIVERSVLLAGGMAVPNLSTTGEMCFNDKSLNDKKNGASAAEVMGHELSHQWWGLPAIGDGGDNKNWSAEGFAVYTTYRVAKETRGAEYAQKNYIDVWKNLVSSQNNNFYNRNPEYLKVLPEKYSTKIDDQNRVTGWYARLPLQILKASELVGGEDKMDNILAGLYKNSEKSKISWQGFLDACGLKEEDLKID